ncbi:hypothetical protein J6590_076208 [Homalodisca vitripennis]|nr:hypothetical protein J6590_076208 [Homalodisca vitripennis]
MCRSLVAHSQLCWPLQLKVRGRLAVRHQSRGPGRRVVDRRDGGEALDNLCK